VKSKISWPIHCVECGKGKISPTAKKGRKTSYKNLKNLPVPNDLEIPTCNKCGAEYFDKAHAVAIDRALEPVYQQELQIRAAALLEKLTKSNVTQSKLEALLGLSHGYLSKVRSGARQPSPMLVSCLRLVAADPEGRIKEVERSFSRRSSRSRKAAVA